MPDVTMYDRDGNVIGTTALIDAEIEVNYVTLPFEVENTPADIYVNIAQMAFVTTFKIGAKTTYIIEAKI